LSQAATSRGSQKSESSESFLSAQSVEELESVAKEKGDTISSQTKLIPIRRGH